MFFIGVTTRQSSSLRMFPAWAEILGLGEARMVGVDVPLDAEAERYREVARRIREEPSVRGALVTSHKLRFVQAARDLFDDFTDDARLCDEVSCIYKDGARLVGHTTDPDVSGDALGALLGDGYWARHGADVLCLGAGGAAVALSAFFLTKAAPADRPRRVVLVDVNPARLSHVRALAATVPDAGIDFDFVHTTDARVNDRLMAALPPRSLVVNATGMGKDRPGSPITDAGVFPEEGVAWELNYRGERTFLRQARAAVAGRGLRVADGWGYFVRGWAAVVSRVFDVPIPPEQVDRLAEAAAAVRHE